MAADKGERVPRPASRGGRDAWVSASDIGTYEYCARAYWLERVQRVRRPDGTGSRLTMGTAHHRAHGRRVAWQGRLVRTAVALLSAGLVLLLVHAASHRLRPATHPIPVFSL
jgi:hypothetical protein